MRVLLDHCVPRPFGRLLLGHEVRTTRQEGWQNLSNGELLATASESFDVFLTVDQNLASQQNLSNLPMPLIALIAFSNTIDTLTPLAAEVLRLLGQPLQRKVYLVLARV
jgi:predicted nuclease of predicted toxin-antitoxin system